MVSLKISVLVFFCVASVAQSLFAPLLNAPQEPVPPPSPQSRLVFDQRFTTKLDHFSEDETTWEMRYFSNNAFYVFGGPMFIFVGGEWPISYGWVLGGHMFDMAKAMNGYIFYTEHRFYGESRPTA